MAKPSPMNAGDDEHSYAKNSAYQKFSFHAATKEAIKEAIFALHWLSKVPEDLLIRDSPTWNGGKIHHTGASEAVFNAYAAQSEKDVDAFLKARSEEIVSGGIVIICCSGTVDGTTNTGTAMMSIFLGSVLLEMVQEGLVSQDQVDTFNIPTMQPSVKQMTRLVEKNGCFSIEKMETRNRIANTKMDSGFSEFGNYALWGCSRRHIDPSLKN